MLVAGLLHTQRLVARAARQSLRVQRRSSSAAAMSFQMGPKTLKVDRRSLHQEIREKVAARLLQAAPESKDAVILLRGGAAFHIHDTDTENVFRQEGYFQYVFGVQGEEDYLGLVDLRASPPTAVLFMPRLPQEYAVWMGPLATPDEKKAEYAVDAVHYVEELDSVLDSLQPQRVYLLQGSNSDSGKGSMPASVKDKHQTDTSTLYNVLAECRTTKTKSEQEVMQYANSLASAAHVEVMRQIRPGAMEFEAESVFLHHCYCQGGCRHTPYTPICASGKNGAVLHYGHAGAPNDCQIAEDAMMLLDMGCEYYGYDSDITCSWPASGRFSQRQRGVYEAVLDAQASVLAAMKPGVPWPTLGSPVQDMHRLAEARILAGLQAMGLVTGDVEDMVEQRIGALFMPHGLGHLLGLDTHDVGGYLPHTPPRINQPGLRSLRTARTLEEGQVITVEPGCYFNSSLLLPAFENPQQRQFLSKDALMGFMDFGGVRIEDDVIVTADGARSMNSVPRTVKDIEAVMAGGKWPA